MRVKCAVFHYVPKFTVKFGNSVSGSSSGKTMGLDFGSLIELFAIAKRCLVLASREFLVYNETQNVQ